MLNERQRRKLRPSESAVWCGCTHPAVWGLPVFGEMAFGAFWSWMLFGKMGLHRHVIGVWTRTGKDPLALKIFITLFTLPFFCVGVGMILAPLRRWLAGRLTRWCITNERILRFGVLRTKAWEKSDVFDDPPRHDNKDGSADFAFAEHYVHSKHGGGMQEDLLEGIPAEEAAAVESALRALKGRQRVAWADADDADADEDAASDAADASVLLAPPPQHVTVEQDLSDPAGARTFVYRKVPKAVFFLIPFMCFWSGISLFGLYGTQIIARHFSLEKTLLGLPFLLGSVLLGGTLVFMLFGSRRLTLCGGELRLWSGVGPFGRTRTLRLTRETKVLDGFAEYGVNGVNPPELHLVSPGAAKPFRLLGGAPDEVRRYVAACLKNEIASGRWIG